jgi:hypothetical protein
MSVSWLESASARKLKSMAPADKTTRLSSNLYWCWKGSLFSQLLRKGRQQFFQHLCLTRFDSRLSITSSEIESETYHCGLAQPSSPSKKSWSRPIPGHHEDSSHSRMARRPAPSFAQRTTVPPPTAVPETRLGRTQDSPTPVRTASSKITRRRSSQFAWNYRTRLLGNCRLSMPSD